MLHDRPGPSCCSYDKGDSLKADVAAGLFSSPEEEEVEGESMDADTSSAIDKVLVLVDTDTGTVAAAVVVDEDEQAGLGHNWFSNKLSSGIRTMLQCKTQNPFSDQPCEEQQGLLFCHPPLFVCGL